jgi:DNA-binding PadR family transcriptional regulator
MKSDPSSLEAALVGLLARGPASGYELRKVFQTTPLAAYSDSPGAVYPALRRLEKRGLVSGREAAGGRRRKQLRLTATGRAWAQRWAAAPVTTADVAATELTDLPRSGALALDLGIHLFRARLTWSRRVAREHSK